ncbi:MAG: Cof-type HAD-IIB family hydrolase [Elusimicrobiota bacterium]|jgi:Cof subfamily protein (haloacid dehalogenase superfamily)|nr:Cof-type HAD-IIB family hydrolase [Elusimicrobiota bacterium]
MSIESALKDVKMIAMDMDHTLLTESGEFPPNFDRYILELDKIGIDLVIASGRPLYTLKSLFHNSVDKMSFISDNGGIVTHKENLIFTSLLETPDYQTMVNFTEAKTDGIAIVCGIDRAYVPKKHKKYGATLSRSYSKIAFVDAPNQLSVKANKFSVYFPNKNSKEFYEKIFKPQYANDFSVTVGDTVWIDIMNLGINKGTAIKLLGKNLGLKYEQMMAFGDTYNDVEMLQAVKHSYIVKNASEDMRQYANFVADSNDNYGVTKVIDKVLKAHRRSK